MKDPFTFKSFAMGIQDAHGGDPVAAALDIAVFQGSAPGNLDGEAESVRKSLRALGYSVVSDEDYRQEIAEKLRDLASEVEHGA